VPTYQPLGQSRDDVGHESCHSPYRQLTRPRPEPKGLNREFANRELAKGPSEAPPVGLEPTTLRFAAGLRTTDQ
jgi:hypothetical protein